MTVPTGAMRLTVAAVTQFLSSRDHLADSLSGGRKRRVVLLRSAPEWDGPAEPVWGDGLTARIAVAASPLAVHELVLDHLADRESGPAVLAVLTNREQSDLDPAILACTYRRQIHTVDGWNIVGEVFGAEQVDSRLREIRWAAEALLDATPPGGWPRLAGGFLSRPTALSTLALRRLRLGRYDTDRPDPARDNLDTHTLLRWSLTPSGPERLLDLREPERDGLADFLCEQDQAGLTGRILVALVRAGHGADAVAYGLICAALWIQAAPDAAVYRARGRLERWLGEAPPATGTELDAMLTTFGRTCQEYVSALLTVSRTDNGDSGRAARRITSTVLDRAGLLSRQFGIETETKSSPLLPAGLAARFTEAGRVLADGGPEAIAAVVGALREHELAADPDARVRIDRARMAQRLVRWLATDPPVTTATVAAAIQRHIAETGWVDQALEHIEAGGDPDPVLKAAYDSLGARVRDRRKAIDRSFAKALAAWTEACADPGTLLTVETFLDRVIRPLVGRLGQPGRRVLLLVLDGMSAAIATELGDELRRQWAEYDPLSDASERSPVRRGMAAALPTLTAVSRTSLFAGKLMAGSQVDEKRLFPQHRFWGGAPAAAFHKDDLRGETAGDPFSPELSEALTDDRTHIAVVLNTIDDRLAKESKLGDAAWRLDQIGMLRELLRIAAAHGMAVIITSDHGHVVDRHGVKVSGSDIGSARHRAPGDPPADTEIALSGSRVVWEGHQIVALWDADARYTTQKAGYHGGVALAEVTIPVLAFLPFGAEPPKGWRELGDQRPAWWSLEPVPAQAIPPSSPPAPTRRRRTEPLPDALFDVSEEPGVTLTAALLASSTFKGQVELLGRKPPLDKIEIAMTVLLEAGTLPTTALTQRVGYPLSRADGFAAVLRQILNYDGVQVLETLPDGRTLRLNAGLLREQFGLR